MFHSLRSLLCIVTNEMPHECLFRFARQSTSESSVSTWLATPGPVFLKRHVRASKMEPLVDEVELLGANTNYAHIRYSDGRTTTVSTKHLAPRDELDSSLPQTSLPPDCSSRVGLNDPPVLVPLLTELNAQPVPELVSTEPEQTPAPQNMPDQWVPL